MSVRWRSLDMTSAELTFVKDWTLYTRVMETFAAREVSFLAQCSNEDRCCLSATKLIQ